jgi:hypothetical protein
VDAWSFARGLALAASCGVFESVAAAPGQLFDVFAHGCEGKPRVDLEIAPGDALRYADGIVERVETATKVYAGRWSRQEMTEGVDEKDRLDGAERGLTWRLDTADRADQTATQPRPIASLVNLLAMCVYERRVHELHWPKRHGEAEGMLHTAWPSLGEEGIETVWRPLERELGAVVSRFIRQREAGTTDPDELQRAGPPPSGNHDPKELKDERTTTLLGASGLDPLDSLERAGIVQDLERTAPGAQEWLSSAEKTLDAGTRTAQSVVSMTRAFRSDDPNIAEEDGDADPPRLGRPLDPSDYTELAVQATRVLEQPNAATRNADVPLPAVRRCSPCGAARRAAHDRRCGIARRRIDRPRVRSRGPPDPDRRRRGRRDRPAVALRAGAAHGFARSGSADELE